MNIKEKFLHLVERPSKTSYNTYQKIFNNKIINDFEKIVNEDPSTEILYKFFEEELEIEPDYNNGFDSIKHATEFNKLLIQYFKTHKVPIGGGKYLLNGEKFTEFGTKIIPNNPLDAYEQPDSENLDRLKKYDELDIANKKNLLKLSDFIKINEKTNRPFIDTKSLVDKILEDREKFDKVYNAYSVKMINRKSITKNIVLASVYNKFVDINGFIIEGAELPDDDIYKSLVNLNMICGLITREIGKRISL